MPKATGKGGSLTFAGITTGVHSWTVNWAVDVPEVTDFADGANDEKKYIVALKDWTADVESYYDGSNTAIPGSASQLTLDLDGSKDYSGSAILVSIGATTPVGDKITQTYHFQGNGTLSFG